MHAALCAVAASCSQRHAMADSGSNDSRPKRLTRPTNEVRMLWSLAQIGCGDQTRNLLKVVKVNNSFLRLGTGANACPVRRAERLAAPTETTFSSRIRR